MPCVCGEIETGLQVLSKAYCLLGTFSPFSLALCMSGLQLCGLGGFEKLCCPCPAEPLLRNQSSRFEWLEKKKEGKIQSFQSRWQLLHCRMVTAGALWSHSLRCFMCSQKHLLLPSCFLACFLRGAPWQFVWAEQLSCGS